MKQVKTTASRRNEARKHFYVGRKCSQIEKYWTHSCVCHKETTPNSNSRNWNLQQRATKTPTSGSWHVVFTAINLIVEQFLLISVRFFSSSSAFFFRSHFFAFNRPKIFFLYFSSSTHSSRSRHLASLSARLSFWISQNSRRSSVLTQFDKHFLLWTWRDFSDVILSSFRCHFEFEFVFYFARLSFLSSLSPDIFDVKNDIETRQASEFVVISIRWQIQFEQNK